MAQNKPELDSQYKIDFQHEIKQFTSKSTQRIQLIQYQYNYACMHPTMDDVAIILQSNFFPLDCEIKDQKLKIETDEDEDDDFSEIQADTSKVKEDASMLLKRTKQEMDYGCVFSMDYPEEENKKAEEEKKKGGLKIGGGLTKGL